MHELRTEEDHRVVRRIGWCRYRGVDWNDIHRKNQRLTWSSGLTAFLFLKDLTGSLFVALNGGKALADLKLENYQQKLSLR
ncbi:hypothetical protein NL676_033033 [Syzygium grande]|nr:hypothetical protein NL676_033033 [Syzygium grande]